MLLIHPSFLIETPDAEFDCMLDRIERAGRTCYKSEDRRTADAAQNFVGTLIARGHESVLEHANITVRFVCDRGVSHEIVRHRLCAFSQESTRYCDYTKGHVCFVIPPWVKEIDPGEYAYNTMCHLEGLSYSWFNAVSTSEIYYRLLRDKGWSPQQARAILPNSLKTEIVVTANLREWRHILNLRTSKAAHPQMREIMVPLAAALQAKVPVVFDSIKLELMQIQ